MGGKDDPFDGESIRDDGVSALRANAKRLHVYVNAEQKRSWLQSPLLIHTDHLQQHPISIHDRVQA